MGDFDLTLWSGGNTSGKFVMWDEMIRERSNNPPVTPVTPAPKTPKEFEDLDTSEMSKEDVLKMLKNSLIALEESEAAWAEEHAARIEAEEMVEKLREAGFTGGDDEPESDPTEAEDDERNTLMVRQYRWGGEYSTEAIVKSIEKKMRNSSW